MSNLSTPIGQELAASALRDALLDIHEQILSAQLSAVRKLRAHADVASGTSSGSDQGRSGKPKVKGRSHIDMAFDILKSTGTPLHASEIIARVALTFGVTIDSESLVSALSKRVARKDRFTRTARNTFALL